LLDTLEFDYGVPNKNFHAVVNTVENIWFKDIFWSDFKKILI